jgi:hypothetical protein
VKTPREGRHLRSKPNNLHRYTTSYQLNDYALAQCVLVRYQVMGVGMPTLLRHRLAWTF